MPQSEENKKKKKNMKKKKHKEEENSDFKTNCTKEVKIILKIIYNILKIMLFKMPIFTVTFQMFAISCFYKLRWVMNRTNRFYFSDFFFFH